MILVIERDSALSILDILTLLHHSSFATLIELYGDATYTSLIVLFIFSPYYYLYVLLTLSKAKLKQPFQRLLQ
ncbi:TPA: hypothetical protein RPV57_001295 [Campylobacter fetus]|uniref:hypothetical protein n=1 Tax=Campylobacter fetus TaxID=196 RepID=UPI0013923260|nr:hypothetical protein [Campylobacter fetus]HDX6332123.1 hypothetical protein [Campylobacter fetus]HEG4796068.1 hypothetical protein [Campylobacter fetus]HEG5097814.1 hypothetical protein [Campylobacter fetus]HEG6043522.1 hypothetical protein [Campylobacter fetus]